MIKKFIISLVMILSIINIQSLYALNTITQIVEVFDDGSYIESTITFINTKATNTRVAKKTENYKNASGNTMWSITVTGTFTYDGISSKCINAEGSSKSNNANWKVSKPTARKFGNTASASGEGKRYISLVCVETISRTVNLSCDKNGKVS